MTWKINMARGADYGTGNYQDLLNNKAIQFEFVLKNTDLISLAQQLTREGNEWWLEVTRENRTHLIRPSILKYENNELFVTCATFYSSNYKTDFTTNGDFAFCYKTEV